MDNAGSETEGGTFNHFEGMTMPVAILGRGGGLGTRVQVCDVTIV